MHAGDVGNRGKFVTIDNEIRALRNEKSQIEKSLPILNTQLGQVNEQLAKTRERYNGIVSRTLGGVFGTPQEVADLEEKSIRMTGSIQDLKDRIVSIETKLRDLKTKSAAPGMNLGALGGLGAAVAERRRKIEGELQNKEVVEEKGEVPSDHVSKKQRMAVEAPVMDDDEVNELETLLNSPDTGAGEILNYAKEKGIRLNDDQLQIIQGKLAQVGWISWAAGKLVGSSIADEVNSLIEENRIIKGCVDNLDDSGMVNPQNANEALEYMLSLPKDEDRASFMKGLKDQLGDDSTQTLVTNMTEIILSRDGSVEEKTGKSKTLMRSVVDSCGMKFAGEIVSRALTAEIEEYLVPNQQGGYDAKAEFQRPNPTDFGELLRKNTVSRQLLKGLGLYFEKQLSEILGKNQPVPEKLQEFAKFFGDQPEFSDILSELNKAAFEFAQKRPVLEKGGIPESLQDRNDRAVFEAQRFVLTAALLSIVNPLAIEGPPDLAKAQASQKLQMAAAKHPADAAWVNIAQSMFSR